MLYDIVIKEKKLNKIKVVVAVILLIVIVSGCTIAGIKMADHKKRLEQDRIIQEQIAKEAEIKRQQEEEARQLEEAKRKRNEDPLTEEQQNSIRGIYNSNGTKRIFLTFDDGPSQSVTPFILDLLKQENIKATFFLLGGRVQLNPDLVKREFEEGHYVANHGLTHKYGEIYSSPEATVAEYNQTESYIQEALNNANYHSRIFRFPGGSNGGYYNTIKQQAKELLLQNGVIHLDWNSLSEDANGSHTKEELLQNIQNTMNGKDSVIILMHDSGDKILTYEMLPDLISYAREQGYEFMNLYDIL